MKLKNFTTLEIKSLLKGIVPEDHILHRPEDLICYSYDAYLVRRLPDLVIIPTGVNEISDVIKLAVKYNIPVIPRGLGSGFTGGAIPIYGGIVISLERLDKIISIDRNSMVAIVESGVITDILKKEVLKQGLFYPPDPSSSGFSTIGGNVAESAGGLRGLKYGYTKNYVIGLEFIDGRGEINKTGYLNPGGNCFPGLTNILISSEGTLGIITKVALRLLKNIQNFTTFFVCVENLGYAAEIIGSLLQIEETPSVLEIVDRATIKAILNYKKFDVPARTRAFLLVEFDTTIDDTKIIKIFKENNALLINKAIDEKERLNLWSMRKSISPSLVNIAPDKFNEDIVVPVSKLKVMLEFIEYLSEKYNIMIPTYGHAGDGNLHVNIMINRKNETEFKNMKKALNEIFDKVIELGGTLSGEHGIGLAKSNFLYKEYSENEMRLSESLKKCFDPYCIINPGKILPAKVSV
ncbi:glycolate oxidase subunit GlcD [candidate division KSB1 bacterium]|nr:MAG: glycolate oxidase subunit GlcD [candidate division KSB1 bacterium]